jgi:hypothetical protein
MSGGIAKLASVLQFGESAMLAVIGAAGILTARWELATAFGIDPSAWSPDIQATMLNQYRFLKSLELGAGIFCFAYRPPSWREAVRPPCFLRSSALEFAPARLPGSSMAAQRPCS